MDPAASSLPYSPQQVISQAFDFDPAELFAEQDQGQVQLDGALLYIKLYQQEESNVLLLMADLGFLPTEQRTAYYQMMLVANSGWRDLAGGALCTDDSGDQAFLRLRLDLDTLGAEMLAQWLAAFVFAAEAWAMRFAATDSPAEAAAEAPELIPQPQDFLGLALFNRA